MSTFHGTSEIRGRFLVLLASVALWGVCVSTLPAADAAADALNVAISFYNDKQDDRAISEFKRFITTYPTHTEKNKACYYLAECLIRKGKTDEAFIYLDEILGKQLSAMIVVPKDSFFDVSYYRANIQPKLATILQQSFARQALFRAGEIACLSNDLENGRRFLYAFLLEFSDDSFNAWTLPYLGDIAKQNYAVAIAEGYNQVARVYAEEAEYYFGTSTTVYPDGNLYKESLFGLAWAEARLGKYTEANAIFRQLAYEPNGSLAENAYYEWGLMYYEQGNYELAIQTLTRFEQQYPSSELRNDSYRVRARSLAGLEKYSDAMNLLRQIKSPKVEDHLLNIRCLFGLQKTDEASKLLAELDQSPISQSVKDEIQILQAVEASVKNDRNKAILILENLLHAKYNTSTRQMSFEYYDPVNSTQYQTGGSIFGGLGSTSSNTSSTTDTSAQGKLSEEHFLKACAVLCANYAAVGRKDECNATINRMMLLAKDDDIRQTHIIDKTIEYVEKINSGSIASGTNPSSPSGWSLAGSDPIPIDPSREGGIDFGPVIDEKDLVPAGGSFQPSKGGNRPNRGNDGNSGSVSGGPGTTQRPSDRYAGKDGQNSSRPSISGGSSGSSSQSTQDFRQTLRTCQNLVKKGSWGEADEKLLALLGNNPPSAIGAEAALLRCKVCLQLGNESEAEVMSDLILNTYHNSIQYGEALWISGDYYEKRGNIDKALALFKILADDYSNNENADGALFHLAWDDLENGSKSSAMRRFRKINTTYRDGDYWSHGTWGLAYLCYENGEFEEADKYVQELLNHPPDHAVLDRVLFLKGKIAEKYEDWTVAEAAYRTLAKCCPGSSLIKSADKQAAIARSRMNENR